METIILTKCFEKQISLGFVVEATQSPSNWGYYLQNETFIIFTLKTDTRTNQGLFFVISDEDPKFYNVYHGTFIRDDEGKMTFDAFYLFRCNSFNDVRTCILGKLGYKNCLNDILNTYPQPY